MTDARERHRLASARWRLQHRPHDETRREEMRAALNSPLKLCPRCRHAKLRASEFYKHPKNKDGLQSYCKTCVREVTALRIMQKARQKRVRRSAPHAHTPDP